MEPFEQSGFLNVFKPVGMTSHDVVAFVKRRLNARKAGHGGTLDPAACGVLVILLNGATKHSSRVMQGRKRYRFEMLFGLKTDTGDAQGKLLESNFAEFQASEIEAVLPRFTGEIMQTPPMASAIKVHGRRLYKSAFKGETVERPPRQVTIHSLELVDTHPRNSRTAALLDTQCGSGTYVRSLAEDIAAALGAVATTSFLLRSESGIFTAARAVPPQAVTPQSAPGLLIPPSALDEASDSLLY